MCACLRVRVHVRVHVRVCWRVLREEGQPGRVPGSGLSGWQAGIAGRCGV